MIDVNDSLSELYSPANTLEVKVDLGTKPLVFRLTKEEVDQLVQGRLAALSENLAEDSETINVQMRLTEELGALYKLKSALAKKADGGRDPQADLVIITPRQEKEPKAPKTSKADTDAPTPRPRRVVP